MADAIQVSVKVNGGIFEKNIPETVRTALREECLLKINDRMSRKGAQGSGGRGLGVQRNIIGSYVDITGLTLRVESSRIFPRTTGWSWQRKNIAIVRAMAPRVLKKAADRIVTEMGSG